MISGGDLYNVLSAVTPLYVAMFLAYGSVKWWKIFTPEQCAGINRFVAVFAVPLLSFEFIYKMNPYTMNMRFLAADVISKAMVLFILGLWAKYAKRGSLEWVITIFSLSTLPNTLVMGIPLLKAMYGDFTEVLMVQTVVFQSILWYAILLFLYEYRSAKMLISGKLQVNSHHVEIQLNGVSPDWKHSSTQIDDQIDAEIGMKTSAEHNNSMRCCSRTLRNPMMEMEHNGNCNDGNSLPGTNTCIHKDSSFNIEEFLRNSPSTCSSDPENLHSNSFAPIASNEGLNGDAYSARKAKTPHSNKNCNGGAANAHGHQHLRCHSEAGMSPPPLQLTKRVPVDPSKGDEDANELHMFVWSSSGSNVSDGNCCLRNGSESENETGGSSRRDFDQRKEEQLNSPVSSKRQGTISHVQQASNETRVVNDENVSRLANATSIPQTISDKNNPMFDNGPDSVKLTSILNMVWRKLVYNPNTYASILGLIWAFTSYRWHFHMPKIIEGSVSILSNAGLGMAMFSLGLFMALQHKIIACGNLLASVAMILRFIVGPVVMATASVAIGLRHSILHVAIVQAALPQGIVPFVFAREYDLHADILSTAVIFGMIVSLPITILYYVLLGL